MRIELNRVAPTAGSDGDQWRQVVIVLPSGREVKVYDGAEGGEMDVDGDCVWTEEEWTKREPPPPPAGADSGPGDARGA